MDNDNGCSGLALNDKWKTDQITAQFMNGNGRTLIESTKVLINFNRFERLNSLLPHISPVIK
jgi:hypothetical protein